MNTLLIKGEVKMSEELEKNLDLDEAKATGEDSVAADAVTPTGGSVKKRKGDLKKAADAKADDVEDMSKPLKEKTM